MRPIGSMDLLGRIALILGLLLSAGMAVAGLDQRTAALNQFVEQEDEFLTVDEAFRLQTELSDGMLYARWEMPPGYYLYRHQFGFEVEESADVQVGTPQIPEGKHKEDEFFGEVEVYYHDVEIAVPVVGRPAQAVEIAISYQGCADRGLCYPPQTRSVSFASEDPGFAGAPGSRAVLATASSGLGAPPPATEESRLAALLSEGALTWALGVFFVGGIALAFTPCVLPMVPILSSIIVGEGEVSRGRAFSLSLAYVLGMAVTYAGLGVLMGFFGAELNLQASLQSPVVLVCFAAVFALLSLSMFGFYELRLPSALQNRLNAFSERQQGGKHVGVVIMGALSALVVSPCVSAPLAGALIYISTTGDAALGGAALLALGLGMGTPLLIIGTSGGHLLPRAGAWMNAVKAVFGVMLLGVAIWLLERVVPGPVTLMLWAALLVGSGVYLGALDFSPRQGWGQLWKASGALMVVYGVLLVIGAASGASDPLKPLGRLAVGSGSGEAATRTEVRFVDVKGLEALQREVALATSAGQPVFVDVYADWCISCKVMERNVFPRADIAESLSKFRLIRADVTENDPSQQALLRQYELFGPPSFLFFDSQGRERPEFRIQGEVDADELDSRLEHFLSQHALTLLGQTL
jgi:thiol:disulfide interchange protein DsbD